MEGSPNYQRDLRLSSLAGGTFAVGEVFWKPKSQDTRFFSVDLGNGIIAHIVDRFGDIGKRCFLGGPPGDGPYLPSAGKCGFSPDTLANRHAPPDLH